ncbi:T9SS type A sorting domain-containing protein [Lewinella sp. LCG006]|uniref:T9SS type A sorting domain-containing protein n=1 Tax=Lewinella sp. LCG006 TaxID=3231911 RepID=UPI00345F424B
MKNVMLLMGLFASAFAYAQTPFTYYFGETGSLNFIRDFTRQDDGHYLFHAYGNYAGQTDFDLANYQLNLVTGELDSTIVVQPANQTLLAAEEVSNGGAAVASRINVADGFFADVMVQYLDANGEETDRIIFGGEFSDSPVRTAIDEQQNFFVTYQQSTSGFPYLSDYRVRMIDAAHETAYDVLLDLPEGAVFDLEALGNGEVIVVADNNTPTHINQVEIIKLGSDGSTLWRTSLNTDDGVVGVFQSFSAGDELYLYDYLFDQIITLNLSDGSVLNNISSSSSVSANSSSLIVKYDDAIWILGRTTIYQMRNLSGSEYEVIASYPKEGSLLQSAKFRQEGVWEYMSVIGELVSMDLNSGEQTVLANLNRPLSLPVREETVNVQMVEGQLYAGIRRGGNGGLFFIVNTLDLNGELLNSITVEENQGGIVYSMLALPNGGVASLSIIEDGFFIFGLRLDIYDESGNLTSQTNVIDFEDQIISSLAMIWLPSGKLGINVNNEPYGGGEVNLTYEVDIETAEVTLRQTLELPEKPDNFSSLATNAVGFVNTRFSNDNNTATVRKLSLDDGLVWETELNLLTGDNVDDYGTSSYPLVANPVTETALLGINLQERGQAPVYFVHVLDGATGTEEGSFTSVNTQISARVNFLNEEQIVLIGCSRNPNIESEEDRFLFNYEVYDLSGNLITQTTSDLPHLLTINGIDVLENGFLLVYGEIIEDADANAMVILVNEEGEIMTTNLSDILQVWGKLTIGPNPSNDLLHIQLENDFLGEVAINVYTIGGRLLGEWTTEKAFQQMTWETSLDELPAGSYWVQVKSPAGQMTAGWVKQ